MIFDDDGTPWSNVTAFNEAIVPGSIVRARWGGIVLWSSVTFASDGTGTQMGRFLSRDVGIVLAVIRGSSDQAHALVLHNRLELGWVWIEELRIVS